MIEELLAKCDICDCWTWNGSVNAAGYGRVTRRGRRKLIHRLVWELLVGPIPDGLVIDHLCKTRNCVNPDHLRVVTQAENLRASRFRRGTCKRGHSLEGDNLYTTPSGRRSCRACKKRASDRWNERRPTTRAGRAA